MGIEKLTELEIITGICETIFVTVSLITGIKMLLQYFKYEEKTLLTIALTWIFLSGAWWPGMLSFWLFIFTNRPLNLVVYLLFNTGFPPLAVMCWIYTISNLLYRKRRKLLIAIFFTICIIYEVLLIIFIFTIPDIVGKFTETYILTAQPYALIFQLFAIGLTLITGIHFAMQSLKSDMPTIRLKARFLLLAFISLAIGILESIYRSIFVQEVTLTTLIVVIIFRFFLISSCIEYYFGFFLSENLAKKLIKK